VVKGTSSLEDAEQDEGFGGGVVGVDDGCDFIGMGLDLCMGDEDIGEVSFVEGRVVIVSCYFGGG